MKYAQKLQFLDDNSTNGGMHALDAAYLNRATFGDTTFRNEIIGLFQSQVDGLVRRLALPMDGSAWQFLTHTLRGASAAVGAKHIAEIAASWEQRPAPRTDNERAKFSVELKQAVLAFERAASNLH